MYKNFLWAVSAKGAVEFFYAVTPSSYASTVLKNALVVLLIPFSTADPSGISISVSYANTSYYSKVNSDPFGFPACSDNPNPPYAPFYPSFPVSPSSPPPLPPPPGNDFFDDPLTSPIAFGMVGMYTADSWSGVRWSDVSGNGNHVSNSGGVITKGPSKELNGYSYIYGGTSTWLIWPQAILPPTYTLFHISKYNNGVKQRIFTGNSGNNWLSGFWAGSSGIAYHDGWLTDDSTSCCGYNWVMSTDQNGLYRQVFISQ